MIAIYAQDIKETSDLPDSAKQIDLCLKTCTGEYTPFLDKAGIDKKVSGKEYKQLLKSIERGEIDKVVVYSLESVFHSVADFSHFWEILEVNGTEFCSVKDNFDTSTPDGRRMLEIVLSFAEIERKNIAQRIRTNYRKRAKNGIYPGGPAPYGFDITHVTMAGKTVSVLMANDKVETVRTIFKLYSDGNISLGKLASTLHESGIPGINRTGWDNVSISRILHNPVYVKADREVYDYFSSKGIVVYNNPDSFDGTKGCWLLGKRSKSSDNPDADEQLLVLACHDGIVDSDIFLKCQRRLDSNKRLKNTGNKACTWLAGLVKCGYCGYSMQAVSANGGKYTYLICTGKTNFKVCNTKFRSPHVSDVEPVVEKQIIEKLKSLKKNNRKNEPDKEQLRVFNEQLTEVEDKIIALTDSLANARGVSADYINKRISELDTEKNGIVKSIKNMLECSRTTELPDCDFMDLDTEKKHEIAKLLIEKIIIKDSEIKIEWSGI